MLFERVAKPDQPVKGAVCPASAMSNGAYVGVILRLAKRTRHLRPIRLVDKAQEFFLGEHAASVCVAEELHGAP